MVIESTNFMLKRLTGPLVSAKIPDSMEKQALLKAIAFNIQRTVESGCVHRLKGGFQ